MADKVQTSINGRLSNNVFEVTQQVFLVWCTVSNYHQQIFWSCSVNANYPQSLLGVTKHELSQFSGVHLTHYRMAFFRFMYPCWFATGIYGSTSSDSPKHRESRPTAHCDLASPMLPPCSWWALRTLPGHPTEPSSSIWHWVHWHHSCSCVLAGWTKLWSTC